MALTDRVTARLSAQRLIELTNPDVPGATAEDTVRLDLAATDTQADFETYAGVVYDDADARHVSVGVDGVIYRLTAAAGLVAPEIEKRWLDRLAALRLVTGANRITPVTTSSLTASRESTAGGAVRPDFDPDNLGDLQLRPPGGREGDRV